MNLTLVHLPFNLTKFSFPSMIQNYKMWLHKFVILLYNSAMLSSPAWVFLSLENCRSEIKISWNCMGMIWIDIQMWLFMQTFGPIVQVVPCSSPTCFFFAKHMRIKCSVLSLTQFGKALPQTIPLTILTKVNRLTLRAGQSHYI